MRLVTPERTGAHWHCVVLVGLSDGTRALGLTERYLEMFVNTESVQDTHIRTTKADMCDHDPGDGFAVIVA